MKTTCKGKNWLFQIEYHWWYKSYLRAGLVPSSRWPTQNKFNGGFKDFLSHNALSWNFPYITDLLLIYYNCQICFYGFSVYANVCVSASIYISCVFSLTIFYICFVFFLFWFVCILSLFKDACLFFNEWERERGKWYTCGCGELGEQKL